MSVLNHDCVFRAVLLSETRLGFEPIGHDTIVQYEGGTEVVNIK
jgi:hypothetical protein